MARITTMPYEAKIINGNSVRSERLSQKIIIFNDLGEEYPVSLSANKKTLRINRLGKDKKGYLITPAVENPNLNSRSPIITSRNRNRIKIESPLKGRSIEVIYTP